MNNQISVSEFLSGVQPFEGRIRQCFDEALDMFNRETTQIASLLSKSDSASVMHAMLRNRFAANFYNVPGIYLVQEQGLPFMLIIPGDTSDSPTIYAKIKKQSRGLRVANIPTQSVKAFNRQAPPSLQLGLFSDVPERILPSTSSANLILGYTLDVTGTSFASVTICLPSAAGIVLLKELDQKVESDLPQEITPGTGEIDLPRIQARDIPGRLVISNDVKIGVTGDDNKIQPTADRQKSTGTEG